MARTRTLGQLIDDARDIADRGGATQRHTDARVTRYLNQAIQRWSLEVNYSGHSWTVTAASGTTTSSTNEYALPSDFVQAYSVELIDDNVEYMLQPFERLERTDFEAHYLTIQEQGRPIWFRLDGSNITLLPEPDAQYTYVIRYLAAPTDLAATADTLDGIAGWEDWVVHRAALAMLTKDNDPEHYQLVRAEFGEIDNEMKRHARKKSRVGPLRKIDTRGRRRRHSRYPWGTDG